MQVKENGSSNAVKLIKNTGIFAIGTFGSKVLVLLVIPLCTHFISTTNMGIYDMTYTVAQLLTPIAMAAVAESLFRWMLDEAMDHKRVFSTWFALFGVAMVLFTIFFWLAWLFIHFDDALLLYLIVVSSCAYQSAQYGTRGLHANRLFAISGITYSLIYCLVTAVLVAWLKVGYRGLLIAILVATLLTTALLVVVQPELRKASRKLFDWKLSKEMLRYSVYLLPNSLSWWALSWLGRVFIVGFLGYAANGIYSVAMKFPSALSMISSIFGPAWQEQAVTFFGKEGSGEYFSAVFRRYSLLFLSLLLPGVPLTAIFVKLFLAASYASAFDIMTFLYLGSTFSAFSTFYGVMYLCAKNTRGAASTTMAGALVTCVASLVLIPTLGVVGAALASMLGNFAMWILRTCQTRKYCVIVVPWGQIMSYIAVIICIGFACKAMVELWQLGIATIIGIAMMVFANRDSLRWLSGLLRGKLNG